MKQLIILLTVLSVFNLYGQQNLLKPFQDCNIKGSIILYDYNARKWISSDINDSHVGTLPASTFKIINTLIVLETGIIPNEDSIIKWPGATDTAKYGYRPEIYHDLSLKEAFKVSAGWAYVELSKRIGKDQYKNFLTNAHYGNADVSINDPDFWNFGNLAISPANQIEILIGIYDETLPFSKRSFAVLKEMMKEEQTDDYTLRAKTGWTRYNGQDIGWWIGYVEKKDNVYFFATRISKERTTENTDFGKCRKEITKTILNQMGVIK